MSEKINILFIEDSEDDALLMIHCLNDICSNLEYQRVESREELVNVLKDEKWDLIITDNAMPQLTGEEAITLIRKKGIKAPIICVSGSDMGNYGKDCLEAGAIAFVLKDNFDELRAVVEKTIKEYKNN